MQQKSKQERLDELKNSRDFLELECLKAQAKIDKMYDVTIPDLENQIKIKRHAQMYLNEQIGLIEAQIEQEKQQEKQPVYAMAGANGYNQG